jgi:hypothetical protein
MPIGLAGQLAKNKYCPKEKSGRINDREVKLENMKFPDKELRAILH